MSYPKPDNSLEWLAVDFDGVLAKSVWPDLGIGDPIPKGIDLAWHYAQEGYRIVIYTARPWSDAPRIEEWCLKHDVPADSVVCGKLLAALYVDNRAHRPEWAE